MSADFPLDNTGTRLLEKFGNAGPAVWIAFLTACKRSSIEGRITYTTEETGWEQLGLAPESFTLDQFFDLTGRLHKTKRLKPKGRSRVTTVICTTWDEWQYRRPPTESQSSDKREQNESKTSDNRDPADVQTGRSEPDFLAPVSTPDRDRDRDIDARADLEAEYEQWCVRRNAEKNGGLELLNKIRREDRWRFDQEQKQKAIAKARDECTLCDSNGFIYEETPDGPFATRCSHPLGPDVRIGAGNATEFEAARR